jgi:hypothetical protein
MMRSHNPATPARPRSNLAHLTRRLGFDRNPLRRGTDRLEAVLRLVLLLLVVVAVPAAAVVVGRQADHIALQRAQAQRAADHLVTAVLLKDAPVTGVPDPYSSMQTAWVTARWQLPGTPARTGEVLAKAGAAKGSTVPVWVDATGQLTSSPPTHRDIVGDVWVAVAATCFGSLLILMVSATLVHRLLQRRRYSAWDAEWRAAGPRWSGHRS